MNWHITTRHTVLSLNAPSTHYILTDAYLASPACGKRTEVRNVLRALICIHSFYFVLLFLLAGVS